MFTLIWARINDWVNNGEADDLRRNRAHYDVIVMAVDYFVFELSINVINWYVNTFFLSGPRLNIKTVFPRYVDSYVKDKTVARPSYL